jgi:hypothetical protein
MISEILKTSKLKLLARNKWFGSASHASRQNDFVNDGKVICREHKSFCARMFSFWKFESVFSLKSSKTYPVTINPLISLDYHQFIKFNNWLEIMVIMFGLWGLTPLSTIVQISWRSVLLVEETGENDQPVASHWQTLSHNVVSSTPRHEQGSNSQL